MTQHGLSGFDLVIFDWAGTMVDFGCCAPVAALVESFGRHGVQLDEPAVRADMGKAKADHVRALLAQSEVSAAWTAANGAAPGEADVAALMDDLGPLMRDAAAQAAELIRARDALGIRGAIVIANPLPPSLQLDPAEHERATT